MTWFEYALLLFALSWIGVGIFQWNATAKGRFEVVSKHCAHTSVTPSGGGIVFSILWSVLLTVLGYLKILQYEYLWLFLPGLAISLIGLREDWHASIERKSENNWKNLPSSMSLIVQVICIYTSLYFMRITAMDFFPWFDLPFWAPYCLLALMIMWLMRSVKFMDGIDGQSTSNALIFFGVSGVLLYNAAGGEFLSIGYNLALVAFGLFALLSGFLFWNWPGAKVFMGEAGANFLGFVMAIFMLLSYKNYNDVIPIEIWLILSAIFWFDPTITFIRCLLSGKNPFKEHSNHAYERLLQIGWSHKLVLIGTIFVNAVMASLAYWAYLDKMLLPMISGIAVCFMLFVYLLIECGRPMHGFWYKA